MEPHHRSEIQPTAATLLRGIRRPGYTKQQFEQSEGDRNPGNRESVRVLVGSIPQAAPAARKATALDSCASGRFSPETGGSWGWGVCGCEEDEEDDARLCWICRCRRAAVQPNIAVKLRCYSATTSRYCQEFQKKKRQ